MKVKNLYLKILERGGYSRSAESKHIKCKVDREEEIG